jgi:3-deoxy-D-manno-octulosonic-acid transferase
MMNFWRAAVFTPVSISTNSRRTKLVPPLITGETRARGNFALGLYRTLWRALTPVIPFALSARAARGKEDRARLQERWGIATRARPRGELIWIHGASIGECMAALPLVNRLLAKPGRHVLVTSGTVGAAELMAERLPAGALHQYVPIDRRDAVRRFLAHWQPDLALFVESELWPNLLLEARHAGVPLALVNARISEHSYRGWLKAPGVAARLLGAFDVCLAQSKEIAERLERLGARDIRVAGSLKADAAPLPARERELAAFRDAVGDRNIFLAASTHPGEEEIILEVARRLRHEGAPVLTVIVPRHPERGEEIAYAAASRGATVARRATGALPDADATVYIADTFGELGLFYRNASFAFLGGSLVPHGGQNPLEASQLGLAVLAGPHTHNFPDVFRTLLEAQGTGRVTNADELHAIARRLLLEPEEARRLGSRAREAAAGLSGALEATAAMAEQLLAARAHARP